MPAEGGAQMSRCREEGSGRGAAEEEEREEEEALQGGTAPLHPPRCQNTRCVSVLSRDCMAGGSLTFQSLPEREKWSCNKSFGLSPFASS